MPGGSGERPRRRAAVYSGGFLFNRRIRRILSLSGYDLCPGGAAPGRDVLVWGHSPHAHRGEAAAARSGASLVRVEDAFLRSLHPGRSGDPPLGLVLARTGMHYDASGPSDLESLLATHPLDDTALLDRAREVIGRMRDAHLTKYAAVDPDLPPPPPGYVLVIDQTRGDAAIRMGGADANSFAEMLAWAREDHPDATLVIKTHPETRAGHRPGHFDPATLPPNAVLETRPISPWRLFEGARAVYTVTSQLGFEAILAGHRPVTFGTPFYAGWGLSDDRRPVPARRNRRLTAAQLAAAALILYPTWYDPARGRLCAPEDVLGHLEAAARAWRADRHGYVAVGMRAWKRPHLRAQFGKLRFTDDPRDAAGDGRPILVWAGRETRDLRAAAEAAGRPLLRLEDGFLRSNGLGADLVPPLSLVIDDLGISYDPTRPSRLEALVADAARRPPADLRRAERLVARLIALGLSKYNLGADPPDDPRRAAAGREVILVPGQVEDDASILLGAGEVATNAALLRAARARWPGAFILYKPHPDVEAGLRSGAVPAEVLAETADAVAQHSDPAALLPMVDRVATITSGLGFEALLRGVPVTTFGAPFYAGWGLTQDLGPVPARRQARPSVTALAHAVLIAYPRYHDPVSGLPCAPELAVERLAEGAAGGRGKGLTLLAATQRRLRVFRHLWR